MSYKPDETTLIDYLYGQLTPEEQKKVEQYFKNNPEAQEQLTGLSDTRKILGAYADKEIIPPAIVHRDEKGEGDRHFTSYKWMIGVAASVTLLILMAFLTDLKIRLSAQELTVRFGNTVEQSSPEVITENRLQDILTEVLNEVSQRQEDALSSFKAELSARQGEDEKERQEALSRQVKSYFDLHKTDLQNYSKDLEKGNIRIINEHLASTTLEQHTYVKDLLIDFTRYLDEQRLQDREFYLNRLIDLKISSDLKQEETEQLLTSIINTVNNLPNEETTQNF